MVNQFAPQQQTWGRTVDVAAVDEGLRKYMLGVYNYMASGLLLSGIIAAAVYSVPALSQLVWGTPLGMIAVWAPLIMIFAAMFMADKMSVAMTQMFFWTFVSLKGISLSYVLFVYTGESVIRTLFITAATFGAMSLYGYTTKANLAKFGTFLIMGMFGILLASIVNIFLGSSALQFAISVIGVLIFTGLAAYETQQLKNTYLAIGHLPEAAMKSTVWGALNLYITFVALFQFLLQLLGNRE